MIVKSPPSLLARIVLGLSITTFAGIVAAYGLLWWEFQSTTGSLRDNSMIETARHIAKAVKRDDQGRLRLDLLPALASAYADSNGVHGFAIRDRDSGEILFAAGADVGPMPRVLNDYEDGALYQYNPDGPGPATYFGEALPYAFDQETLVVQVVRLGSDYQDLIETVLQDFFEDGGWMAGPFLLILLLVSSMTVRATLAPLRQLSKRAEEIGPSATNLRLPEHDVPREVMPLVNAVNRALDRLEDGYRAQRDFTADAAHELRTPLAVLTANIDTLPDQTVAQSLKRDLQGMTHLVEQLLRIAHAEVLVVEANDQADLAEVAREVAEYLGPLAIRSGRMIEVEAPDQPVFIHGQSDALFHALRNLVDNALRHTPAGTSVIVEVTANPPCLVVRDHGPGVIDQVRSLIFRRFWRANRRSSGAGLGLAIVQRIMLAHGGDVVIEDVLGGGAQFRMVFPST